jgi:integrase/recombinase XerD
VETGSHWSDSTLAGHSHISTTQRYIDVNSDQLIEAVELL